jgi:hypothetical protein
MEDEKEIHVRCPTCPEGLTLKEWMIWREEANATMRAKMRAQMEDRGIPYEAIVKVDDWMLEAMNGTKQ